MRRMIDLAKHGVEETSDIELFHGLVLIAKKGSQNILVASHIPLIGDYLTTLRVKDTVLRRIAVVHTE